MFDELDSMKTAHLKNICRVEGIPKFSKLRKQQLIAYIKEYRVDKMIKKGISLLDEV